MLLFGFLGDSINCCKAFTLAKKLCGQMWL